MFDFLFNIPITETTDRIFKALIFLFLGGFSFTAVFCSRETFEFVLKWSFRLVAIPFMVFLVYVMVFLPKPEAQTNSLRPASAYSCKCVPQWQGGKNG